MSAIDFYCTVDKLEGTQGERRVVITFNGEASILRRVACEFG
jgi:cyanate lyase